MANLWSLVLLFGHLSLLAVGGATSTVPEISRQVVGVKHWVTPTQFAQLFAISNAAPGPNVIISTVIGAHVAGAPGGVAATLAMILPSGILAIIVSRVWEHHREARWRQVLQASLLPITAGLVLGAAGVLVRQADTGVFLGVVTVVCAGLSWRTSVHPLWLLGGGALLGFLFV
jgi:chromate transporter